VNPERRSRLLVGLRAALIATAFVSLWVWLALFVRRFDPHLGISLPSWLRPVGIVLAVAGGAAAVSCVVAFATRGRGTPAPFDPPQELVVVGPYRFVRNPMYVGAIAVIFGAGLALSSPAIVLLAALAAPASHLFVVFYEEPALKARFGESYLRYTSRVPRWLIRIRT
jgi:protein-S-isoprenylcysteine O-methyltransferase Ste14